MLQPLRKSFKPLRLSHKLGRQLATRLQEHRNMAATKLLVVFALFHQLMFFFPVHEASSTTCHASGFIHGKDQNCHGKNSLDSCCIAGKRYPQFRCSPPVSSKTPAILTLTSFVSGGEDGQGIPPYCDMEFHSDRELVVTLSSGWFQFDGVSRCSKRIRVHANGRSAMAKVVDECDSVNGCDSEHGFEPPCRNNVLGASPAVWKALKLNESFGEVKVTWSDV